MFRILMAGLTAVFALSLAGVVASQDEKKKQDEKQVDKKRDSGPVGLPTVATLKEKLTLTEEQAKKVETIYADSKEKAQDAEKKGEEQKKVVKSEIIVKIKEVTNDEQDRKLDELCADKKEKKTE